MTFFWCKLMNEFECHNDTWLNKLYNMFEKWCPGFIKDYFLGIGHRRVRQLAILFLKRLSKAATLYDFY